MNVSSFFTRDEKAQTATAHAKQWPKLISWICLVVRLLIGQSEGQRKQKKSQTRRRADTRTKKITSTTLLQWRSVMETSWLALVTSLMMEAEKVLCLCGLKKGPCSTASVGSRKSNRPESEWPCKVVMTASPSSLQGLGRFFVLYYTHAQHY